MWNWLTNGLKTVVDVKLKALPAETGGVGPRMTLFRVVEECPEFGIIPFLEELAEDQNASWLNTETTSKLAIESKGRWMNGIEIRLEDTNWEGYGKLQGDRWIWEKKQLELGQFRLTPSLITISRTPSTTIKDSKEEKVYYGGIAGDNKYLSISKTFNFIRKKYYEFAERRGTKLKNAIRLDYLVTTYSIIELIEFFDTIEETSVVFDQQIEGADQPIFELATSLEAKVKFDRITAERFRDALINSKCKAKRLRGKTKDGQKATVSDSEQLRFVITNKANYIRKSVFAALDAINNEEGEKSHPLNALDLLTQEFDTIQEAIKAYQEDRIEETLKDHVRFKPHGRKEDDSFDEQEGAEVAGE